MRVRQNSIKTRRPQISDLVSIRKEAAAQGEKHHKILPQAEKKSLKVTFVSEDGSHLRVNRGGHEGLVSHERVVISPRQLQAKEEGKAAASISHGDEKRLRQREYEYLLEKVANHAEDDGKPEAWFVVL